jgi:hypothetical protein
MAAFRLDLDISAPGNGILCPNICA